ncbi:hypothetical protein [Hydrogenimonas sp.]
MHLLHVDKNAKILEVGDELFKDAVAYLKSLTKKRGGSFQYIDEAGDVIVVDKEGEYVLPTRCDIESLKNDADFVDEEEAKRLLGV